jgi:hypothetical protein
MNESKYKCEACEVITRDRLTDGKCEVCYNESLRDKNASDLEEE